MTVAAEETRAVVALALAVAFAWKMVKVYLQEFVMSLFFQNLISWAKKSPAVAAGKQEAIKEVTDAFSHALDKATQHAPDMIQAIEPALTQALTAALTGVLTKSK